MYQCIHMCTGAHTLEPKCVHRKATEGTSSVLIYHSAKPFRQGVSPELELTILG